MASIFDEDPNDLLPRPPEEPEKPKRGKHRESLTHADIAKSQRTMMGMVEKAFDTLEAALTEADFPTAIKAAQLILDRSGFGPRTTLDVNTTTMDLTKLSREELAERAQLLSNKLRGKKEDVITEAIAVR